MFKTKIIQYLSWQRLLSLMCLVLLIAISIYYPLSAQSVTEGYDSDQSLQRGMIVRLKKDDATKVEAVSDDDSEHIHGVVVNANDSAVTLSVDGQRVFVATSGHYDVLVSTLKGNIAAGDYIAVSPVSGIGMKAGNTEPYVIGRALAVFDGSKDVISTSEVKDSSGAPHKVSIGRVQVDIGVAKNPLLKTTEPDLPTALRRVAENVAGKPVNGVRVYISILVFGITTVLAGSLLYGGVRSAITSIGRNPLSRKSIIKGMVQVIITGMIVFITGVFGVYLILRI